MSIDYRAELQRLVKAYDEHGGRWPDHHEQALFQAVETARTTLAQPEPGGVGEVKELVDWLNASAREWADLGEYDEGSKCHRAADILTRWGRPVIEPVAEVATPGEDYHEDLDPVLWWRFPVDEPPWCGSPNDSDWPGYHTHFTQLPAVPTLPVPQQQQQEVK